MIKDADMQVQFWKGVLNEATKKKHPKLISTCEKLISEAKEQIDLFKMELPPSEF